MNNMQAELKKAGVSIENVSEVLNVTKKTATKKLNSPGRLGLGEAVKVANLIKAKGGNSNLEYLNGAQS